MATGRVVVFGWADSVHVHRWAEGMAGRGYDIKVVSLDGWEVKGCETVIFPRAGRLSYLKYASAAAEEARKFRPDLIHAHYLTGFGLWAARTKIRPSIVSVWGADIVDFPRDHFRRLLVKSVLKRATAITATSRFLEQLVGKISPQSATKTSVIPFGVTIPDTVEAEPSDGPIRLSYIKHHKLKYGPVVLLHALAKVKVTLPDIQLAMAGSGAATEQLKELTSELRLESNVEFVGQLEREQIYPFLQKSHIMVMPSICDEAFGVAVLEASACARPVIATRVGGVPEVLRENETGLLVAPDNADELADAIVKLAGDVDTRKRLGAAGRAFVQSNYTWERSLDLMAELYERLIHGAKK